MARSVNFIQIEVLQTSNLSIKNVALLQVYTAEQIVEKGRVFHTGCFTCKKCKKPLKDKVEHRSPILRVLC